jgi:hyperosmotically inducible periplasmic protein
MAARLWFQGLASILLVGALYGCSTVRDPWQDARIESEVKARLVEEKNANLTRLGVVSRHAVVYLSGSVASADEKALAERLAGSVPTVSRVVSTLQIRAPGS